MFKNWMLPQLSISEHTHPFRILSTRTLTMARPHILFALVVFAWSLQVFSAALPYESSKLVSQCRNTSLAAQETCKEPLKRKEWLGHSVEPV